MALEAKSRDPRFREIEESLSAVLRFPGDRLATLTTSFGSSDAGFYEIVGTKGRLRVEPAFDYAEPLKHVLTIGGKTSTKTYKKRDQFAAELLYFSECVLDNKPIEPSGDEGVIDMRIIETLHRSAALKRALRVSLPTRALRPRKSQEYTVRPVTPPRLVRAEAPSID